MTDAAPLRPHLQLRAATQAKHEQVDATFAGFDLADPASYAALLSAHARALPAIEEVLAGWPGLPSFSPRTPALAADLAELGQPLPPPDQVAAPADEATAWGMLYVIEGSRLGGAFLARAVPASLPKAYLSAAHARGGWRALLDAFDAAAAGHDQAWLAAAIAAARATFDRYAAAVGRAA